MQKNETNFKALTFVAEQTASTFNYEVKGVRALWDPSLAIPGTNRRGGWRCPVGTRYGGQITDRFGRSCGWGVARRIANQIADIGERLENIDDRKRNNRLAKRNARMQRFLAREDKPGLLERGARNVAEALEGGQTPQQVRPPVRPERRQPLGGMIDPNTGRVIPLKPNPAIEQARELLEETRNPRAPRRRRGNLRESEARRMEREIEQPGAPRTGEAQQPNVPRRRRRTAAQQGAKRTVRRKPEADFVDGAQPEKPIIAPRRVDPVRQRQEYLARLDADLAKRKKEALRNRPEGISDRDWKKYKDYVNGIENRYGYGGNDRISPIPSYDEFLRQGQVRRPVPAKPQASPAKPQTSPAKPQASPPKPLVVEPDPNFNAPEPPKPSTPIPDPPPWNPTADEMARLGGSLPDARSERNVRNRFRERGLPETAYWREDAYQVDDKAELERRFGRYYDDNNQRNERGNYVNRRLASGGGKPANRSKPPSPKTPKTPPASPAPQVPQAQPANQPKKPDPIDLSPAARKKNYRDEMGRLASDGLPDIEPIPVGNRNINNKDEARQFLKDGGSLADVPNEFLADALKENSDGNNARFEKRLPANPGVNDTIKFTDKTNGKIYYLKYHSGMRAFNEDIHEIVGNNIGGRMGLPFGQYRMDGKMPDGRHRSVLLEDVRNYMDGNVREVVDRGYNIEPVDKIKATLLDFAILNVDRHHGNFFEVEQNGKLRFAPIDPSLGFDAKWGGVRVFKDVQPNEAGLREFLFSGRGGGRNRMLEGLRNDYTAGRISRDDVVATVAEVQRSIKEAERKNPFGKFASKAKEAAIVPGQEDARSKVTKYVIERPGARLDFLADVNPARVADIILGL